MDYIYVYPGEAAVEIKQQVSNPYVSFQPVEVFVAAAGSDWPDFQNLDDEDLALPNVVSNNENGLGYVAPILMKTYGMSRRINGAIIPLRRVCSGVILNITRLPVTYAPEHPIQMGYTCHLRNPRLLFFR